MKTCAVILAMLLMPFQAIAQERLQPEPSVYAGNGLPGDYDSRVASAVNGAFDDNVIVRMIGLPAFLPEYAVGIRKAGSQFEIFGLEESEQLKGYDDRHPVQPGHLEVGLDGALKGENMKFPGEAGRLPAKECSIAISPSLATHIADVWRKALLRVRNGDEMRIGSDGEIFHFGMREGMTFMAGMIWSPDPNTLDGDLVEMAFNMKKICTNHNATALPQLERQSEKLLSKLQ